MPHDGGKERVEFPDRVAMKAMSGEGWSMSPLIKARPKPMVYRLFSHKDDPAAAIYFHPSDPAVPNAYPPFYDQGQLVTPVYWGNHWPLNRGKWTGWAINDQIGITPGHHSVAGWGTTNNPETGGKNWEVKPLTGGDVLMPDASGQVRAGNLWRFAWMTSL